MKILSFALLVAPALFFAPALLLAADEQPAGQSPIPAGERLKIEGTVAFNEGPAWHPSGNVYFTEIENNRIMRRDRNGQMHTYRIPSGGANGLLFDQQGRLLACEGGTGRRVSRTELDGTITNLADRYDGKRFNSPNDLAVDSKGRIYFTDPRYGDKSNVEQRDEAGRPIEAVYRIDADGSVARIITDEVDRPNGILVSPGDKYLYVADNVNDGPNGGVGGARKLWRFNLNKDGTVDASSRKLLFDWGTDRGPDGMAQDTEGRLYVTAGFNFPSPPAETAKQHKAGVYIIDGDSGKLHGFVAIPEDMCTNCTFGDNDLRTLYVTAGHTLYSIRTNATGHLAWPKPKK